MIAHVLRRAMAAELGPVFVATDSAEIAAAVRTYGGAAVMTGEHESGSDRIYEALEKIDREAAFDAIVNVQGDLPTIAPHLIRVCLDTLSGGADIGTLAAEIEDDADLRNPNVVKVIGCAMPNGMLDAHSFTRAAPCGSGPHYHHIGIYAYKRAALQKFVALPPSTLELRERLEQLRALEAGMRIHVSIVDTMPIGVDTEAELEKARALRANKIALIQRATTNKS